jgi:hypothetical protein
MTDFRALCAELLQALETEGYAHWTQTPNEDELCLRARAALAQPEPQGVTDEELLGIEDLEAAWNAQADAFNSWDELGIDEIVWWAQRQALARWGTPAIQPVPVSERLPLHLAGELDDQGTCWNYHPINLHYCLCVPDPSIHTHWLPHWALPVPESNSTTTLNQ